MDADAHDRAFMLISGFRITQMVRAVTELSSNRTEDEYRELLRGAGLRLTRVLPTDSRFQLIEAVPT